jgi:PhnB protein
MPKPDGTIMHADVKISDSIVMIGEATDQWKPMPASIYLYVTDADAVYKRASGWRHFDDGAARPVLW